MYKYLVGIAFVIFLVLLYFHFASPAWIKCYWISQSNFIEAGKNVYVSPLIPKKLIPVIQKKLKEATIRVKSFWGNKEAEPIIVFCANQNEFTYYGSQKNDVPALTHMTAMGAFIVVQLDGISVDILAHELTHAELLARLGWFVKSNEIPTWFDEGLALQLDFRYPFNTFERPSLQDYEDECRKYTVNLPITEYKTAQKFYGQGVSTHINYLFAGKEIRKWMHYHQEQKGLLWLISQLKKGKKFEIVYYANDKKTKN
ncbi:MAG: hypothetical protein EAZ06_07095 [Cytophagales bacterium]|nr:MAG: hypothetical protein EAY69_10830 [Cytophagales bacterium]TAH29338.1 MAG: hypothetical protein EAZ06_07095 [Cytophagales bacterium]